MEKKEIKHTPTPWKYGKTDLVIRQEKTNHPIADCTYQQKSFEENTANAGFIVRAVNSHDELVEAIKNAIDSLPDHVGPRIAQVKKELSEAIAKAEGKA